MITSGLVLDISNSDKVLAEAALSIMPQNNQ
jgi:hypothetical protein